MWELGDVPLLISTGLKPSDEYGENLNNAAFRRLARRQLGQSFYGWLSKLLTTIKGRFSGLLFVRNINGAISCMNWKTASRAQPGHTTLDGLIERNVMPKNVYSEINLHMTWHTKNNDPVLIGSIQNRLYHHLEHEILKTKNVFFHAVGGTEDHVHLVTTIPPSLLISEWIGRLKGGSSFYINHEIANRKLLDWQEGYGVVSFGTKDLKWVVDYVKKQKEHHARGTTNKRLERSDDENPKGR